MSYILEALKKSQQAREMGQVPRLQATAFDDPPEFARSQPWVLAAVGLAALAAVLALYAALRPTGAPDASMADSGPSERVVSADIGASNSADVGAVKDAELRPASGTAGDSESESPDGLDGLAVASQQGARAIGLEPDEARTANASSGAALGLSDPDDLSVEPQVLIVPAPPKPGERLPRGADELRRALLGPDVSPSIERRQSSSERTAPPAQDSTPVPPELIAEIEAFKRTFQTEAGTASSTNFQAPARDKPAVSESSPESSQVSTDSNAQPHRQGRAADRPPPLSSRLRQQLPPFLMTVHVYDKDPARRFVYLNGSKVREGGLTRDGFFVEQVLADGAIVRYEEHRFFQSP
ncbi:MAG: general secretion pathway protein GspB [Lamprobacter sp.]|uniref:general secretion pathway protein GspB n=1 Tax=Lamprobacter sp. TaxID=3100796 RepID=UPI002B2613A6|nr:general secretion pathway protein GspB [Lamprobacter sp.]MEA3639543.1 general secretion pathway protein GspB [Lamprobacter sp.]